MAVEAMGMQIRIPQGDTGSVKFVYEKGEVAEGDRALFTVAGRGGATIMRKVLEPNEGENAFQVPFTYGDTAGLNPDTYEWSLRVVRDGVLDGNNKLKSAAVCNTAIANGKLFITEVAGGAR